MTSIGLISAARMMMPMGKESESEEREFEGRSVGDFRRALTTSLTPRLSVR